MSDLFFAGKGSSSPEESSAEQAGFQKIVPAQHQVFHGAHVTEELDVLKCPGDPEFRDLVRPLALDFPVLEHNGSSAGVVDAVDAVEESGFPCPVRPDDGVDFTLLHIERDVRQGFDAAERYGQMFNLEETHSPELSLPSLLALFVISTPARAGEKSLNAFNVTRPDSSLRHLWRSSE